MKIHSLEIRNIRGIRHYQHNFQGKNAVILGPNGTGKSSLLDAIDFLLNGDISRLQGEGTSGISLRKHGLNIKQLEKPQLGFVKATVSVHGHGDLLSIERYISDPETLVFPNGQMGALDESVRLAGQGQHMLTRRQMLRFITIPPADRAAQIQELMSLRNIEVVRKNLVSVFNKLKQKREGAKVDVEASRSSYASILGVDKYESTSVLSAVNDCRQILGTCDLEHVTSENIREHVSLPSPDDDLGFSPTLLTEYATNLLRDTSETKLRSVEHSERNLREKLHEVRKDDALLRSLSQQKLLELGLVLTVDDYCPLCDTIWKTADLRAHLEHKVATAANAGRILNEIRNSESEVRSKVHRLFSNLEQILSSDWAFEEKDRVALQQWKARLESLKTSLQDSLDSYALDDLTPKIFLQWLAPQSIRATIQRFKENLKSHEDAVASVESPETVAYTRLAQAESALEQLEKLEKISADSSKAFDRIKSLSNQYVASRDQVLGEVYDSISGEFVRLYSRLHPDEETFEAKLQPNNAGLKLHVDFYGRGLFVPNALHSDGHQDSMGLCLFLVLSERLSGEALQFMLLDDVISSIDVGHRRALATLLANEFPNRQVIVTTHDPDWNKMLVSEKFAVSPNLIRFDRWDIEEGVVHTEYRPDWDLVEEYLNSERLLEAATVFRNWAERFFKRECHNLKAPVPFDIDGRYTLDAVISPGLSRFKDLLKRAMKNSRRNGNSTLLATLESLEDQRRRVYMAIENEVWLFNRMIHDNEGVPPTSIEIRNAVTAVQHFYRLLHCENCSGLLEYSQQDKVVRCKCGNILWAVQK